MSVAMFGSKIRTLGELMEVRDGRGEHLKRAIRRAARYRLRTSPASAQTFAFRSPFGQRT